MNSGNQPSQTEALSKVLWGKEVRLGKGTGEQCWPLGRSTLPLGLSADGKCVNPLRESRRGHCQMWDLVLATWLPLHSCPFSNNGRDCPVHPHWWGYIDQVGDWQPKGKHNHTRTPTHNPQLAANRMDWWPRAKILWVHTQHGLGRNEAGYGKRCQHS